MGIVLERCCGSLPSEDRKLPPPSDIGGGRAGKRDQSGGRGFRAEQRAARPVHAAWMRRR